MALNSEITTEGKRWKNNPYKGIFRFCCQLSDRKFRNILELNTTKNYGQFPLSGDLWDQKKSAYEGCSLAEV